MAGGLTGHFAALAKPARSREWATERKRPPLPDVAAAHGSQDDSALLECYQAPDEGKLLALMSEPAERRESQPRSAQPHLRLVR